MATTSAVGVKAKSDADGTFTLDDASHKSPVYSEFLRRVKQRHGIDIMGNVASRCRRQQYLEVSGTHIGAPKPATGKDVVDARWNQADSVFKPDPLHTPPNTCSSAHEISSTHAWDRTSKSTGGTSGFVILCDGSTEDGSECAPTTHNDRSTSVDTSRASTPCVWKKRPKSRLTNCTNTQHSMKIMSASRQTIRDTATIDLDTSKNDETKLLSGRTKHFNSLCDLESMLCDLDSKQWEELREISAQGEINSSRSSSIDSTVHSSSTSVWNIERPSPARKHSSTTPCASSSLTTTTTKEDSAREVTDKMYRLNVVRLETRRASEKTFRQINRWMRGVLEYENTEAYDSDTGEQTQAGDYKNTKNEETIGQSAVDVVPKERDRDEMAKPSMVSQPQRAEPAFADVQHNIVPSDSFTSTDAYEEQSLMGTDTQATYMSLKVPVHSLAEASWRPSRTACGGDGVASDVDCGLRFDGSVYSPAWTVYPHKKDCAQQTLSSTSTIRGHNDYPPQTNVFKALVRFKSEDTKPKSSPLKETKITLPIPVPPPFRLDKEAMKKIYVLGQSCMLNFVKELRLKLNQEKAKNKRAKRAQKKTTQKQEKHWVHHPSVPKTDHDSSTLTTLYTGLQANTSVSERSIIRAKIVQSLHSRTSLAPKRKKKKSKQRAMRTSTHDVLEPDLAKKEPPEDENPAEPAPTTLKIFYLQPSRLKQNPTNLLPSNLPTYKTAAETNLNTLSKTSGT